MQTMTLDQLRAAGSAGGIAGVTLKADVNGFVVEVDTRSGQSAVLSKARSSEPRRFGNPTTAIVLLREMGILLAKLDMTDWEPMQNQLAEKSESSAKRSQAMREAYAAAAHTKWLAQSIEQSIADPRPSVSHDDVLGILSAEIDALAETAAA